jgi:hypothetical protein
MGWRRSVVPAPSMMNDCKPSGKFWVGATRSVSGSACGMVDDVAGRCHDAPYGVSSAE